MRNKNTKFIILLGVIILVSWFIYNNSSKQGATQHITIDPKVIENGTLSDSGNLSFLTKKSGQLQIIPVNNLKARQSLSVPELVGYDAVMLNPSGNKVLAIQYNYDEFRDYYTLVDLSGTVPAKALDQNWYNPKWVGDNEIYYTIIGENGSTSDIFSYDTNKDQSTMVLSVGGDTEDDFAKLGDYLVITDSSSDASPISVKVYDLKTKKVVQDLILASITQLLSHHNQIVLIGEKMVVLTAGIKAVTVEEYPLAFDEGGTYTLTDSGDKLIALQTEQVNGSAEVKQFNRSTDSLWQELDLTIDLEKLGYLYSISATDNNLVVVTASGIYDYEF